MKGIMEHSDAKHVEYFDDNVMEHCDDNGMGFVMKKAWSLLVTGFKEHSDDKSQGAL